MKYKNAKVISHPRAGSHYFAKLLNDNFFHKDNYLDLYAGHSEHHVVHLKTPNTAVFYIYRNNTDTIKSMFVMRDRLGLVANNIEEFRTKKLSKMHNRNIKSRALFNGKPVNIVDTYLSNKNLTIDEYLDQHKQFWNKKAMFIVNYQALQENFESCMLAIAQFLESDKTEFVNEHQRVGWHDAKDQKKIFS